MRAIILAAGRGSRMGALTTEQPKCLVEIGGKTLLDRQIGALRGAGVAEIAIVTGYKRELLADRGLFEFHNPSWAETNMVSSLERAAGWLASDDCIVSYSDIFYDAEAPRALAGVHAPIAITYDPNWLELWRRRFGDPLVDAETFRRTDDGALTEIGGKPTSLEDVQGQYMGLLRFTPEGWSEIARIRAELDASERDRMHMTGTLQRVVEAGRVPIACVPYANVWGEIDSEQDLERQKAIA